jgi:hypothetical protein
VKRQLEVRVEAGILKEEEADEATQRAEWEHDGLLVAKAVLGSSTATTTISNEPGEIQYVLDGHGRWLYILFLTERRISAT